MEAAALFLHVQYIFPSFQTERFKSFFELLHHLIAAGILDVDIAVVGFCAESDDSGGTDIALKVTEHSGPVGFRRIDAENLFPFLAVKIVKVCTAPVGPGLRHELFMEQVDIFFAIDHENV